MKPKLLVLSNAFRRTTKRFSDYANPKYVNQAQSGKDNFEKDFNKCHVQTNIFQRVLLGVGSGVISITNPSRGDMVAVMGEVTGSQALEYVRTKMLESEEGRKILEEKPRISSVTVDLKKLQGCPEGTLGKAYINFLQKYGYSPDARNAVQFVDDIELAYVAQRYREAHDLLHTLLNMPTNMLGEVTVKWVEAIQTKLPMCVTGALFGSVRLGPKLRRSYSKKVAINIDSSLDEQIESDKIKPKRHSGVMNLNCIKLPDTIIKSIQIALEGKNRKQLIEDGLALERKLLHRSIPVETYIWNQAEKQIINNYKQKHPDYDLSNSKTEKQLKNIVDSRLKHLFYNWKPIKYDKNLCLQYLIIRAPAEYAVLKRVFNEIALRDKDFEPKSIFDFGSGVGTVVWAAHDFWSNSIKDYYCVDASSDMHNLATSILQNNNIYNDPFIKTVHYRQFLPSSYRPHDIVVSSFSFFELQNWKERLKVLTTLWNNTTHYLVLIEIGSNAGYNLILEARDYILNASNQQNIECYVFAPCSHELECPRLSAEGKRTPCNFKMAYHQFPLSQLSYKTGIQLFSFLILKKGKKPPLESRQCRIVRDVKLGHKHAVCHLCTNKGKLQSVFVTASKHKKSVYKCFRSSNWGDLTPQGITFEETVDSGELVSDEDSDEENFTDIKTENSEAKQRKKYVNSNLPWAIETGMNSKFLLNIYFEQRWEQTVDEIYKEFNIKPLANV